MKNTVKKGFSIIELIFVMVILVALAAIAIPSINIYSDDEKQTLAQMKFDLEEAIYKTTKDYINKKDFSLVIPNAITGAEAIEGINKYIYKDLELQLFNKNIIDIKSVTNEGSCTNEKDSELYVNNGFEIKIYNKKMPDKAFKFNSCTNNKIELIDIK